MAFTRGQIRNEFKCRPKLYICPLSRKRQRVTAPCEPAGECRCYSKGEIFIYECKQFVKLLNNLQT